MANSKDYNFLMSTLRGSMRYEFEGTVLTLTQYYSGKSIKLDLGCLTDDMLEELIVLDDDEDEYDEDDEEDDIAETAKQWADEISKSPKHYSRNPLDDLDDIDDDEEEE